MIILYNTYSIIPIYFRESLGVSFIAEKMREKTIQRHFGQVERKKKIEIVKNIKKLNINGKRGENKAKIKSGYGLLRGHVYKEMVI